MLVPSNTGKLPRVEFRPINEAGGGAHTAISGVQVLANPARAPNAGGCTASVATADEAPVRNRYDDTNWYVGSVGGKNSAPALAPRKSACAGVTWNVPSPGTLNGVSPKFFAPILEKPVS